MKHLYFKTMTLALLICTVGFIPAQGQETPHHASKASPTKAKAEVHYSCPMHPDVTAKSPGKCPKCGMELQPVSKRDGMNGMGGMK